MHAWGQDRASNNALFLVFREFFVFALFTTLWAQGKPHFISNPVFS
jgi:hypothetical protein